MQARSLEHIAVAVDTMTHAPFRPIKSTRHRVENQRAHAAAVQARQQRLEEIERLARDRSKYASCMDGID